MEQAFLKNGSLRIFISDRELDQFGLTFASLDIHIDNTKTLLRAIMRNAGFESDLHAARLTVEAMPVEGGCLLLLTPQKPLPARLRLQRHGQPVVYALPDADALMELAAEWKQVYPPPTRLGSPLAASSLYAFGDGYRLIVYPVTPLSKRAKALLTAFGDRVGSGDAVAAFTAEHGSPLCIGDALTKLCG